MASTLEKNLLSACQTGDNEQVDKLLSQTPRINVNCRDEEGRTPLYLASWGDHADIVQKLLTVKDADVTIPRDNGLQPIHPAAESGHIDVVSLLLSHGVDINTGSTKGSDNDGQTPVISACLGGSLAMIKWLIEKGADINITRHDGYTVMHSASERGHSPVIEYLLGLGFNVNAQKKDGATPLYCAAQEGQSSVIPILLQAGADPQLSRNTGSIPLHIAAQPGHPGCLSLLIPVSDINTRTKAGNTALIIAAYFGNNKCCELLLEAGADADVVDGDGDDALGRAAMKGHDSCVLLLLKHGAQVRWDHQQSPLKLAQEKGHTKVIELLNDYKKSPEKYKTTTTLAAAHGQTVSGGAKLTGSLRKPAEKAITSTDKHVVSSRCSLYKTATDFIKDMKLSAGYFDPDHDVCFCGKCHRSRGDNLYYTRGDPPKDYGLPLGWCKFGLKVPARAAVIGALDKWHVAFHGTKVPSVEKILRTGELLMPGDVTPEGAELRPPPGHFDPTVAGKEPPRGFDISKIYLSPSMRYSGCNVYAPRWSWKALNNEIEHHIRVAFQVRIEPGTYDVGPETIGAGKKRIDPRFSNRELEWSTKRRGVTVLVGLLVKVEGMGDEPDLDWSTQVAAATPVHPQQGLDLSVDQTSSDNDGKRVSLLYPFNYTIAPGVNITLEQGDKVTIQQELGHGDFLVKVSTVKKPFVVPRNFLDI